MNWDQISSAYLGDVSHLWAIEYAWVPLVLLLLCAWRAQRAYGYVVAVTVFWFVFSAIRVFFVVKGPYPGWLPDMQLTLEATSAGTVVLLFLYAVTPFALDPESWILVFKAVAVVNSWWVIIGSISNRPWGVLLNASMSGCFSACLLPLFFPVHKKASLFFSLPVLVSVFFSRHSLPLATLSVILGVYCARNGMFKRMAVGFGAILCVGSTVNEHGLLETSGRLHTWKLCVGWFWKHANHWFGVGSGSFSLVGPTLTQANSPVGEIWPWMHSEPLQVLLEQGIVGLVLLLIFYIHLLYRSRKTPQLFYCLVGYGAFSCANMPMRYIISALFGAFLVHWSLNPKEKSC